MIRRRREKGTMNHFSEKPAPTTSNCSKCQNELIIPRDAILSPQGRILYKRKSYNITSYNDNIRRKNIVAQCDEVCYFFPTKSFNVLKKWSDFYYNIIVLIYLYICHNIQLIISYEIVKNCCISIKLENKRICQRQPITFDVIVSYR